MSSVCNGDFDQHFDKIFIFDCRFDYEYNGGHIKNAIHCPDEKLLNTFFDESFISSNKKKFCFIFHCEFSSKRGPEKYFYFRSEDRRSNSLHYPNLHYPDLYLLEGGYEKFFESFSFHCQPQNYIRMNDKNYEQEMKHSIRRGRSFSVNNLF